MLTVALQGHTYRHVPTGRTVMAMENGSDLHVREVNLQHPWPLSSSRVLVSAEQLEPLPMTYFGGEVPQKAA